MKQLKSIFEKKYFELNNSENFLSKKHIKLFITLTIFSIFAFSFELFNFTISIDEEIAVFHKTSNIEWIKQDRWGMYFLSFLFYPNPVIPTVPLLFTLIFSAFSVVFVSKFLKDKNWINQLIFGFLFLSNPILYYVYHFNTINYGIGLGFLLSALALYNIFRNKHLLFCALLIAVATSIYQVFLLITLILFSFKIIHDIIFSDEELNISYHIKQGLRFFLVLLAGFAIYYGLNKVFCYLLDVQSASYANRYIQFSNDIGYWKNTIGKISEEMKLYYFGSKIKYLFSIIGMQLLLISSLLYTLYNVIVSEKIKWDVKIVGVLVILFLPVIPFIFNFLSGGYMPPRAIFSSALVIGIFPFLAIKKSKGLLKFVLTGLVIICVFQFIVRNNQLAYSNHLSFEADKTLAMRVASQIDNVYHKLPDSQNNKAHPVVFLGKPKLNRNIPIGYQRSIIGKSFWVHGKNNEKNARIVYFLRMIGMNHIRNGYHVYKKRINKDKVIDMPKWPKKGSVDVIDNLIIVNF